MIAVDAEHRVICNYWPLVSKLLRIVQIFTGRKADEAIDKVILAGETLCAES